MAKKFSAELCYEMLGKIPRGKVVTYKEMARALGTKGYRAVGQSLKRNEHPESIPCFKVVKSDGSIGGYSGNNPENIKEKIKKLNSEGIIIKDGKIELDKYSYKFQSGKIAKH